MNTLDSWTAKFFYGSAKLCDYDLELL